MRKTATSQQLINLPSGLAGINFTLGHMRRFVEQYKTSPQVRELALSLIRDLPQKDFRGEADRLFTFVKDRIRYVKDIHDVETVQTPVKTLELGAGDCDDKATLLAALLESIGHETRFHAMGFEKGTVSHVLLETRINGRWIAMDTTEPVNLGWLPPHIQTSIYR